MQLAEESKSLVITLVHSQYHTDREVVGRASRDMARRLGTLHP